MNFKNPAPTVDIIIEIGSEIVLIERKNPPYGYAIPGGFIDEGESAELAAVREAKEETGLDVDLTDLLYVYSDPLRDPRKHTLSIVYTASAQGTPFAGDDAKRAFLCRPDQLPEDLVFDHSRILGDYAIFKKTGKRPQPSVNLKRNS
ncbi:MAG: NUDIX hydrolase [Spirochaetia bacterium]|nr:NUDIX hydrolase [Spirochaetia bacterium]